MKKKSLLIILVVAAFAVLIGWRLASNKKKIDEKKKPVVASAQVEIPVNIEAAANKDVNGQLVKTGTLVPFRESEITATAGGNLVNVQFELGSQVREGQVVAQVDSRLLQLKIEATTLQRDKFQADYNRYKTLLQGDATTETSVQDMKYNLDNANNQLEQLKKQLADNQIKAPVNGQVVTKKVEAGEYVAIGTVLGKVVDISKLKADVLVSEKDAYELKNGDQVKVTTDLYPGKTFPARVIFISQQGDAAHNYQVQVELANSGANPLKAGTFIYVDFIRKSRGQVLQIPRTALAESLKDPYVYVVENGKAATRKISVGRDFGNYLEVISGLNPGEQIVTNGQINLYNGAPVKIVK